MANGKGILDSLSKVAKDLLGEMGGSAYFNVKTDTGADTDTDRPTGETITRVPASGNMPCMPPFPFKSSVVDGTIIQTGDMQSGISKYDLGDQVLVPLKTEMTITTTDFFTKTVVTNTYTVVDVMPVYSGNSIALVELHLRGHV